MMSESRFSRGVITVLTLMVCIWVLDEFCGPRAASKVSEAVAAPVELAFHETVSALPPVEIQTLPLAALDNTCVASEPADLSGCTGLVSGAPARAYLIQVGESRGMRVRVEPLDPSFDVSLVVESEDGRCLSGQDRTGPGYPEQATVNELPEGVCRIVVGGYGDLCGPYRLIVEESLQPLTEFRSSSARRGPNGTVVRWDTFAESEITHFVVFRRAGDSIREVGVIRGHGSPAGFSSYRILDRSPEAAPSYEVHALAADGRTQILTVARS